MAFRGGGRWRGRGRGRGAHVPLEPFILFPENVELPPKLKPGAADLVRRKFRLEKYWKFSPYYIQDKATNSKNQYAEIERYSDRDKPQMNAKREPLTYYLKLTSTYFPVELLQGSTRLRHNMKNLQWDNETGLKKLDVFEKLEDESREGDKKSEKTGKEAENDAEEDEDKLEEEDEVSDDGDYNQNVDFDDDEDDLNIEEEDDGPCY